MDFEELWQELTETLENERVVYTLARKRSNKVTSISTDGIWVLTEKSSPKSELVPRWMFEKAYEYLSEHGSITNSILLGELRVMRSAFVLAALSRLKYFDHTLSPLDLSVKHEFL